jgi:hypothetical protein
VTGKAAIVGRLGLGGALLGLLLGGCSLGSSGPPPETITLATSHGLSYSLKVTTSGKGECATTTYRTSLPDGRPMLQSSHLCGPPALGGHPVLIQAAGSPQAMLADVAATGCGIVRAGRPHAALRPLAVRCTLRKPHHRVAVLPVARRLIITGVPGAPVLNFPRHICRASLCITPLA